MNALSETNRLLLVICIAFLAVGLFQGAIGPVLQDLARQTNSNAVAASGMMTAVVFASLSAQSIAVLLLKKVGHRPIMVVGMIFFLCGISGVAVSTSLTWLLIAAACKGVGDGVLLLLGNVLAAEASKGAGPLNLVNAMFGVGAIVAPALTSAAMLATGSGISGLWVSPMAMAVAFVLLTVWRPTLSIPADDAEAIADAVHSAGKSPVLKSRLVWLVSALALLESGIEASVGIWLPTLLSQSTDLSLTSASMVLSWFWFLLTASRFVAAWASRKFSSLSILAFAVALCIAGCALLLASAISGNTALAIAAVTFLGPGLGPVLPSALSILRNSYPRNAGAAAGIAFGATNLGAGVVPPLLGVVTAAMGVASGSGTLLVVAVLMAVFLLAVVANQRMKRNSSIRYSVNQPVCPVGSDS